MERRDRGQFKHPLYCVSIVSGALRKHMLPSGSKMHCASLGECQGKTVPALDKKIEMAFVAGLGTANRTHNINVFLCIL